jgi:hypothetical protein
MNTYPTTLEIIDLSTEELLGLEFALWNDAGSDEVTKLLIFIALELKHRQA